jgi:hypothetical protein
VFWEPVTVLLLLTPMKEAVPAAMRCRNGGVQGHGTVRRAPVPVPWAPLHRGRGATACCAGRVSPWHIAGIAVVLRDDSDDNTGRSERRDVGWIAASPFGLP